MEKGRRGFDENDKKLNIAKIIIIIGLILAIVVSIYSIVIKKQKGSVNNTISKNNVKEKIEKQKIKSLDEVLNDFGGEILQNPKEDTAYVSKDDKTYTVYQDGEIVEGQVNIWTGESKEPKKDESGNIEIYTPEELKWIADQVISGNDNFKKSTITLKSNLDLGARKTKSNTWEGNTWQAIIGKNTEEPKKEQEEKDNKEKSEKEAEEVIEDDKTEKQYENIKNFAGIFDGNGYNIRGLYIDTEEDYQGLFGFSTGTIKNLTIKNSYIKGGNGTGAIVGLNSGTILDCNVQNTSVTGLKEKTGGIAGITTKSSVIQNCKNGSTVTGNRYAGGISGYSNNNVNIKNCENFGDISGTGYIGGITGIIFYGSTIQECKNTAQINGEENIVGGLVGYGVGQIESSYNEGNVLSASFAGGIIGVNYSMGNVEKCYNNGNIDGDNNIGGIVGINKGSISSSYNTGKITGVGYRAGGICGQNSSDSYIYSCYNIGNVDVENNPGGIVGGDFGTITNCYYLNTIIKDSNEQAKSEEELKNMFSELGSDFKEDTENINNGYPILIWQSNQSENVEQ